MPHEKRAPDYDDDGSDSEPVRGPLRAPTSRRLKRARMLVQSPLNSEEEDAYEKPDQSPTIKQDPESPSAIPPSLDWPQMTENNRSETHANPSAFIPTNRPITSRPRRIVAFNENYDVSLRSAIAIKARFAPSSSGTRESDQRGIQRSTESPLTAVPSDRVNEVLRGNATRVAVSQHPLSPIFSQQPLSFEGISSSSSTEYAQFDGGGGDMLEECDHTELLQEKITAEYLMDMAGKLDDDDLEDFLDDDVAEEASVPPHVHLKSPRQISDADDVETMPARRQPIWRIGKKPAQNADCDVRPSSFPFNGPPDVNALHSIDQPSGHDLVLELYFGADAPARTILLHRKPSNPGLTYMHYDDVKHFELIMSGLIRLDLGVPLDFSFTNQKIGGPFARIGLLDSNDSLSEAMIETLCSSLLQLDKAQQIVLGYLVDDPETSKYQGAHAAIIVFPSSNVELCVTLGIPRTSQIVDLPKGQLLAMYIELKQRVELKELKLIP